MLYREVGFSEAIEGLQRAVAAARGDGDRREEGRLLLELAAARAARAEADGAPLERLRLRSLRVAAPCSADWDAMDGDARVRFCAGCGQNVFNVSAMPEGQAEALLRGDGGRRPCVRFYRRADGTVMTPNCSVGLARQRPMWATAAAVGVIFVATALTLATGLDEAAHRAVGRPTPFDVVQGL